MSDIETLKIQLNEITNYPQGLKKVDCEISGIGFFPGARGLWNIGDEKLADKSIMILGHDFGAERDYKLSVAKGEENQTALTWRNLNKMLDYFKIEKGQCFFTNAFMGVRTEGSALGKTIGYNYPEFMAACQQFFIEQIEIQKPELIIVLGLHVLNFLATLSPQLSFLSKIKSYKKLDAQGLSSFEDVTITRINGYTTNIVFITHPTYWHLNVKHRQFGEVVDRDAELKLINKFLKN